MKQIAEKLGLSVATVSYVYNDKWRQNRIPAALAEKVQKTLREEGYRPDPLGRQLKTGKTQTVGVILSDLTRTYNLNILAGLERAFAEAGYLVLVCNSMAGTQEREHLETLLGRTVEGVILTPHDKTGVRPVIDAMRKQGVPVVFVDNYLPGSKADFVVSDNRWGAQRGTEWLIARGCRRIVYVGAQKGLAVLEERFDGYAAALRDAGIPVLPALICDNRVAPGDMYETIVRISSSAKPDAFFAGSFLYFRDGFRFLAERGLKVPDDLALMGFDPVDLGVDDMSRLGLHEVLTQPLPFVEQKARDMGEQAAQILLERIAGSRRKQARVFLKPEVRFLAV
ncbi:MAG: LacI family DNA-binding transcriptional regulator [Kiritimatiellae bacterium]|nr:LacI family DNA-binding transcriptional regulator [Kiritimatiellia bacterium]